MDEIIGVSLLTSIAYRENKEKYLIVTSNQYKAQRIFEYLSTFLPYEEILLFPADELVRAETLTQSKELMATRLYVLDKLLNNKAKIVIANVASATRYLPNKALFAEKTMHFTKGMHINLQQTKKALIDAGYMLVNKVDQSLQFAVRGDIIDIFSVNLNNPIRIELFDDEIESIRYFDIATQTSTENVDEIIILPASDFLLTDSELQTLRDRIFAKVEKTRDVLGLTLFEKVRDLSSMDIDNIVDHNYTPRLYRYYSLIQDEHSSLFDYCDGFTTVLVDDKSLVNANQMIIEESSTFLNELFEEGKIIPGLSMYQDISRLYCRNRLIKTSPFKEGSNDIVFNLTPVPFEASKTCDIINMLQSYINTGYTICISLSAQDHIKTITEILNSGVIDFEIAHDFDLPKNKHICINSLNLPAGFCLPDEKIVYLTSKELFNQKNKVSRFDSRFREATVLSSYEELTPGDYIVHEYQGIGQFMGIENMEVDGVHRDYLKIAYYGSEVLYVPLTQLQLIRKYQGKEGAKPRISHLFTKDWENTKKKIKERINDLATRLYNLYKERSIIKGFAFQKDDEFQKQFDDSFEFELTKDQARALQEVKDDMMSDRPMDRLLCGDVGFGKTEVAFSAIFKAISSGKQAMILCPTTLLARQHYEKALQRFAPFDIKIAIFSRLVKESKQKEYIQGLQNGSIHLAIGTHRLLSKEINFKDLGLLVVDEEQRFGVEQKEKIKEMKNNIDVLSLSATPIPRTLQISLVGVRSLSLINTAPQNRMPIQTYVTPYDFNIVKELIERELGRQGQVFYLHNNVSTIYEFANRLAKKIPSARIGVAHGQMNKDNIEDVMIKFYGGEIDVLVCTTIIENGIDIPNANLIIVEDSVNYGLSQLYQIKGRVGRGDRIAYAYLMYNGNRQLNDNAKKRLKALQDFTELGSGYKIAQRDLMIRGAGDILGPEQAGFIDSIGLDMYVKLLNEAVKEKIEGKINNETIKINPNLSIEAYIPDDFAKGGEKIELYQEILSASSLESLSALKVKMKDLYGSLPLPVEKLFTKRRIDLLKDSANVSSLKEFDKMVEIILGNQYINIRGVGNILFEALIPYISFIKISYVNHAFKILMNKNSDWITDLQNILNSLYQILQNVPDEGKIKELCD